MMVKSVWLRNFRNHENLVVDLQPDLTVVQGLNGSGKTNILEAIYLLSTGDSQRVSRQEEMVHWQEEIGAVKGKLFDGEEETTLEVDVTRGVIQGKRTPVKRYMVNGVKRQKRKFSGQFQVVWFGPEDLELISGSPSKRRRWLDNVLIKVDVQYEQAVRNYEGAIKRRNKVLEDMREGNLGRESLRAWDKMLVENGEVIQRKRMELVAFVNKYEESGSRTEKSEVRSQELDFRNQESGIGTQKRKELGQKGMNNSWTSQKNNRLRFEIVYDESVMSWDRLEQYARQEVAAGRTLVGPHRDDLMIKYLDRSKLGMIGGDWQDLRVYGSRGQQRMGVLWLKMKELDFVEYLLGEKPVLLLDDILSELDLETRTVVWDLAKRQQTVMTSAEEIDGIGAVHLED